MGKVLALTFVATAALAGVATMALGDVAEAESAFAAGEYREAHTLASAAIEENQVDIRARLIAGMAGLRLLDDKPRVGLNEVEEHFRMVLDLAPDTPGIHYLLGYTLFQKAEVLPKRRRQEALELYDEAAKLFAEDLKHVGDRAGALQGSAVSLGRLGRIDEALEAHDTWIALTPSDPAPYVSAIKLAVAERRAEEAAALLERAAAALEDELPGLFELGLECSGDDEMLPVLGAVREMVKRPWERAALELLYFRGSERFDLAAPALEDLVAANPPESIKKMLSTHFQKTFTKNLPRETVDPRLSYPVRHEETYVRPSYPERARGPRIEATVIAVGIVLRDGTTRFYWAHSSRPGLGFEDAALEAARQWKYEPGTVDGKPVDFFFVVRVEFNLG